MSCLKTRGDLDLNDLKKDLLEDERGEFDLKDEFLKTREETLT